jgi:stearoyl-CoA desaturase (delta-9 desaturase)
MSIEVPTGVSELPDRGTLDAAPDGVFPPDPVPYRLVLTAVVALGPVLVLALVLLGWIHVPVTWFEIALGATLLMVVGHGITIGFHRLFSHRSFVARRPLKIGLAVLGSMAFQGSLIGWVADHRRHHRFADRPGDPHSPFWVGHRRVRGWRGFWHAHVGWTFRGEATPRLRFVADLLADRDLVLVDRLFIPLCLVTLGVPFGIGYLWTGTLGGAMGALVIAGVIRVGVSHNVTWSINSVCHRFGRRPFATRDASTNVAALALLTGGESWHNNHHAFPRSARHGIDRGQIDTSALLIRLFERLGWAHAVQWPEASQVELRRAVAE